ncbi:MAG: type II toxin-antitoxin system MqsA family antitoxin [Nitrosospira sp.]|nr:type II toxin-antitoxin system MqsA family antitoxin [Nitrosospira sp.]
MKCPVCEKGETVQETRDLPYTYKGQETVFKAISGTLVY